MRLGNPGLALVLLSSMQAHAQFKDLWNRMVNPDVVVQMVHPPGLGLKVSRVALIGPQDANTQDLIAACSMDLTSSNQIDVVDRTNFQSILREQELGASGYLKPDTITSLGKLLGAAALVTIRVNLHKPSEVHLTNHTSYKNKQGYTETSYMYISKTQVDFNASVQVTDLTTGKVYATQRLAFTPALENRSERGYPEFPPESQVHELAIASARTQVHRMFLSWTEQRKLIFFDDKDYGMKDSYLKLKVHDYKGALEKSKTALEACAADPNAKPKFRARVNYNLGMSYMILGDYDGAKPYLMTAKDVDPASTIFMESLGECQRALDLRDAMRKVDERSAEMRQAQDQAERRPEQARPAAAPEGAAKTTDAPTGGSPEARLEKLKKLHKNGVITKAEHDKKRSEILKDL